MKLRILKKGLFLILFATMGLYACDQIFNTKPPAENKAPDTTIANVPVNGDTLFALVTLHWDGEDNDGFAKNYEWRYSTVDLDNGDSTITDWMETTKTSLTISFNSPGQLNKQVFEVRTIDNKGKPDDSPAKKVFFTKQTIPPEVTIATPSDNSTRFYLDAATDWYRGVHLTFDGEDADGSINEYGWAVDDGDFTWTADTSLYISPETFGGEGEHIIRLTAKDNTNLTSSNPDTAHINLIKPSFDKDILVIDETRESDFPFGAKASDAYVDSLYQSWFHPDDQWDFIDKGMPPREILSHYKMIIWHADNRYSNSGNAHKIGDHKEELSEYMNVGGDFIMSGWKILKSLNKEEEFPRTFSEGEFTYDYLHIKEAGQTDAIPGQFVGAIGVGDSFSDVYVDTEKVKMFPYSGGLLNINTIPDKAGFTSTIYSFRPREDTSTPEVRGQAVGIRYYGTSFNAVVLGFPMYFLREKDAKMMAKELLLDLGYKKEAQQSQ